MQTKLDIPSLYVVVVHPDQLEYNPTGIAGEQLPVLTVPAATLRDRDGVDVVVDRDGDLHRQVHDEYTLGTELVGQNLNRVGNEETRPGECVSDTVEPDEDDVGVANSEDILQSVLLAGDGGADEEDKHTGGAIRG